MPNLLAEARRFVAADSNRRKQSPCRLVAPQGLERTPPVGARLLGVQADCAKVANKSEVLRLRRIDVTPETVMAPKGGIPETI
jgi:hypothetical protein